MIKKFIKYYKNNPRGYWFKRKIYGWGWMPVKWQGWLVVAAYVAVLVCLVTSAGSAVTSQEALLIEIVPFLFATAVLFAVCYAKGEKPRWQWGLKK